MSEAKKRRFWYHSNGDLWHVELPNGDLWFEEKAMSAADGESVWWREFSRSRDENDRLVVSNKKSCSILRTSVHLDSGGVA